MQFRALPFLAAIVACARLVAQSALADLSAPALAAHATLPQNDRPGIRFQDAIARAVVIADAQGLPSRDIVGTVHDEPSAVTNLQGLNQRLVCWADAMVIGHTTAFAYQLSGSGQGIYGAYDVAIDSVLRNNSSAPISPAKDILVTSPEGSISIGGATASYDDEAFPRLQSGKHIFFYLDLLRRVAGTSPQARLALSSRTGGPGNSHAGVDLA
ncbi:MAG TPA: hypothetical protein VH639_24090 [Bryobacteraceae bacterium]|jgi:hypothetical protein